ncbi:hypothetical protein FEM48_Zijuj06G0108000 [Ziziphus jujuba var. spinosa]|nr:hypothetical protein FEM48_Zijuj06G0108000 [Ziziphus jujuba var. spinosa]
MSLQATGQQTAIPPPRVTEESNAPKFNLKMAIVMVLLVTIFFILGFVSVYTRQCTQNRLRGRADLARGGMARGLDPDVIETFPTFVYSTVKEHKIGSGALECAVCLNEFQDDETLRLIPKCDHVFHPDCIDMWLITNSTCPVCRTNLVPNPGESPYAIPDELLEKLENEADQPDLKTDSDEPSPPPRRQVSVRVAVDDQRTDNMEAVNQGLPPRSRSTGFGPPRSTSSGWRFSGLFPRSQSTGHSLVRPGENIEKYTLKLPDEVRNKLLTSALNRTRSGSTAFPRVGSSRRGYRSQSVRTGRQNGNSTHYDRFEGNAQSDRWQFSMAPPFIFRSSSVRSSTTGGDVVESRQQSDVPESNRPPLDRKRIRKHEGGERSTDQLRPEDLV